MRKYYFIIWIIFLFYDSSAQIIKVFDEVDLGPIDNVYIFNDKQSALTNNKGETDISLFGHDDTLTFQHPAYQRLKVSYQDLKKQNFEIALSGTVLNILEVVVSGNKWEQNKRELPNKIIRLSEKNTAFYNPQTTADLLGTSNEVFIQKSQMGGGSPMIRGFAANRVLLVIDGVRMNNAIYRGGNLQNVISLDPNIIGNTEIIFGPGSVVYGSDALGGVLDFHTIRPRFSETDSLYVNHTALVRYSSANNEKLGHFHVNVAKKKWSSLTSISFDDFDNLRMGSQGHSDYNRPEYVVRLNNKDSIVKNNNPYEQIKTAYNQYNLMQKIRWKPNDKWDFNYGFHYSKTSNIPRYDRLIQYKGKDLKYAEWYYGPQKWLMHALNIAYTDTTMFFDKSKLTFAYQNYEESRHDRKLNQTDIRERTENVDVFSLNWDFDKSWNKKHFLFYGLELVSNKVNSVGYKRNILTQEQKPYASRYPDGSTLLTEAAYLNYKINLNEKFIFLSGVRFSHIGIKANFDTSFYQFPYKTIDYQTQALNGSLGLVYHPKKTWQFNLNLSSGFRAPNIDDIGKVFDSEPGRVVVPNPNLLPEYVYNVDLGFTKTIAELVQLEATMFFSYLQNAMVRRPFLFDGKDSIMYDGTYSAVEALVNTNSAIIYGVQAGAYANISRNLIFKTNATYTKGKDQDGFPMRHVSPFFGSSHLIYKANKIKLDFYVCYNGEISNKNLALSEQDKAFMYAKDSNGLPYSPAWYTLNLKGIYQLKKSIQLEMGVENILDKCYRPYSSGIAAPGINFIVALRASF